MDESAAAQAAPGDMSRRVARRREELGKSIEEVAEKAGVDPGYLRYFEQHATARLSAGTVMLLALALETTPAELYGGLVERPQGRARPGAHPELRDLTAAQCEAHLGADGVGRLVFVSARGPVAYPVNYAMSDGDIVISTTVAAADALENLGTVGFQLDRVDEALSEGWSVLATGTARRVDDPDELHRLAALELEPWAGGARHALVRITPDEVTGRVIVHETAPE
jgi:nitroimidazol reductase NimA-like FMN-containing flavoprotein (pyridoxamine 5'-phosphate oxidase superfamily)